MTTSLNDLTYGVEIETVTRPGRTRQDVANAIQSVVGGYVTGPAGYYRKFTVHAADGRKWAVMTDASISAPYNSQDAEVVSPILTYADVETLQEVVRAVARTARVNRSCGIHVHVGADALDAKAITRLARNVYANEELLYALVQTDDNRKATWCRPVCEQFLGRLASQRPSTKDALAGTWYNGQTWRASEHYDNSRYAALNLHSVWQKGTVEFRLFEATLHAGKVKSYLQLVGALACKAINSSRASATKRTVDPNGTRAAARTFLRGLKLDGPEFATLRTHLLTRNTTLTGWAAFANGRPSDEWAARHGRNAA